MNFNIKKLSINAAGTTNWFYHPGGAANFSITGTFGGTTVTIERSLDATTPPGSETWSQIRDAFGPFSATEDYNNNTAPLAPCWIRVVASGGTPSLNFIWSPVKFV